MGFLESSSATKISSCFRESLRAVAVKNLWWDLNIFHIFLSTHYFKILLASKEILCWLFIPRQWRIMFSCNYCQLTNFTPGLACFYLKIIYQFFIRSFHQDLGFLIYLATTGEKVQVFVSTLYILNLTCMYFLILFFTLVSILWFCVLLPFNPISHWGW